MEGEKQVINGLVVSRKKLTQVFLQESFIGLKIKRDTVRLWGRTALKRTAPSNRQQEGEGLTEETFPLEPTQSFNKRHSLKTERDSCHGQDNERGSTLEKSSKHRKTYDFYILPGAGMKPHITWFCSTQPTDREHGGARYSVALQIRGGRTTAQTAS